MNRDTEILIGGSRTGKTVELIKRSAESGIYILVANRKRAEILVKQATDMKIYMPFPVTLQEWLSSSDRFRGSSIYRDGLLIDDIDDVIRELFLPIEIKAVTLRTPNAITNLDRTTADVVEVRHGEWKIDRNERTCSECGFSYYTNGGLFKYCPDCGAKMDGKNESKSIQRG